VVWARRLYAVSAPVLRANINVWRRSVVEPERAHRKPCDDGDV